MHNANFLKGIGVGLMAGAALGWVVCQPGKNGCDLNLDKRIRSIGSVIENLGKNMQ